MFYKARIKGTSLDVIYSLYIRALHGFTLLTHIGDNCPERLMPGHGLGCSGYFRWKLLYDSYLMKITEQLLLTLRDC